MSTQGSQPASAPPGTSHEDRRAGNTQERLARAALAQRCARALETADKLKLTLPEVKPGGAKSRIGALLGDPFYRTVKPALRSTIGRLQAGLFARGEPATAAELRGMLLASLPEGSGKSKASAYLEKKIPDGCAPAYRLFERAGNRGRCAGGVFKPNLLPFGTIPDTRPRTYLRTKEGQVFRTGKTIESSNATVVEALLYTNAGRKRIAAKVTKTADKAVYRCAKIEHEIYEALPRHERLSSIRGSARIAADRAGQYVKESQHIQLMDREVASMSSVVRTLHGSGRKPPEKLVRTLAYQMALALSEMHAQNQGNFAHRDIKLGNFLLSRDGKVKVYDFGLSTFDGQKVRLPGQAINGTFLEPNSLTAHGHAYTAQQSDLYALGCAFQELATGIQPPQKDMGTDPAHVSVTGESLKDIAALLRNQDPKRRPSAQTVLSMTYFHADKEMYSQNEISRIFQPQ